jgi:hypothetical protein
MTQPTSPSTPSKADRVAQIVELMVSGTWVTGKTGADLAKVWGLGEVEVRRDAAEASRHIGALFSQSQRAERRAVWLANLEATRAEAIRTGRYDTATRLLELEGKALGHFEPDRLEVASTDLGELLERARRKLRRGAAEGAGTEPEPEAGDLR